MHTTRQSKLVLVIAGLVVAGVVVLLPLAAAGHDFVGTGVATALMMTPFAGVGALVARRQPSNPIGWILLALALLFVYGGVGEMVAIYSYRSPGHPLPLARLAVFAAPLGWLMLLLLLPLPIVLFPDGRPPSSRWRWVLAGYLAVWAVVLGSSLVVDLEAFTASRIVVDSSGELPAFNHATGWYGGVIGIATPLYGLFTGLFVLSQILAFRRSAGERRQQLKWLMAGGATSVAGLTTVIAIGSSGTRAVQLIVFAGFVAAVALPLGMGVGILRFRLYDIDRLISRTLSYAILTGLLAAVFIGIVVLSTQVLPFSSPVGVAASTLAAAALFMPLRRRVQGRVDRRFNRARYDAEAIVSAFSARLRDALDVETVHAELLRAVDQAVEPARASVWARAL